MERTSQPRIRRIVREIHSELDALTGENFARSAKKIKKLIVQLKKVFYAADKAIRQEQDILANNLQQVSKERSELRESLRELRSLQSMAKTVRFKSTPGEILAALREIAGKIIPVEECNIFLFEKKTNTVSTITESDGQALMQKVSGYLEEGIIDWVFDEGRAVIIEDFETIGGEQKSEKNVVFVPLLLHGNERGMFVLYTPKPKHEFTHQDLELLMLLTEQGSVAVENYRIDQRLGGLEKVK